MPAAVLFDLDDTLFDHRFSARAGLDHWRKSFDALASGPFVDVELAYSEILEAVHLDLMAGTIALADARVLRTRTLFERFGESIDRPEAERRYVGYRAAYDNARRTVPGASELVGALRTHGLPLGVVTNNRVSEQIPKLEYLGFGDAFDTVVISEAEGVSKPDPQIFQIALERLGVAPGDTVMVGDSLGSDIQGAEKLGLRAVWLDHDGRDEPGPSERRILRGLFPHAAALAAVLGRDDPSR